MCLIPTDNARDNPYYIVTQDYDELDVAPSNDFVWPINEINFLLNMQGIDCQFCNDNNYFTIVSVYGSKYTELTNFWIIPIVEQRLYDRTGFKSTLKLLVKSNDVYEEITLGYNELAKADWISDRYGYCSGLCMRSNAAKKLQSIVNVLCAYFHDRIKIEEQYEYEGFSPNNSFYIKSGEKITEELHALSNLTDESKQERLTKAEFVDKTVLSCLERDKMLSLLAIRLLSPYATQLKYQKNVNLFALNIVGTSGCGKTTLCRALYCGGKMVDISFANSTFAAISKLLNKIGDKVVVVDDAYPPTSSTQKKDFKHKVELLCRTAGDVGTERQLATDSKRDKYKISCIPALTGEMDITSNPSTLARMYSVRISKNEANSENLLASVNNATIIDDFCKLCLSWCIAQPDFVNQLYNWYNAACTHYLLEIHKGLHRYAYTAALIDAGCQIFLGYMKAIGYYDEKRCTMEHQRFQSYLLDYVKKCEIDSSDLGTLKSVFDLWSCLLEHGECQIQSIKVKGKSLWVDDISDNVICYYYEPDNVFYLRSCFMKTLKSKALDLGMEIPSINMYSLRKMLFEEKVINDFGYKNTFTIQKKISGKREYVCVIKGSFINKYLGGIKL